MANVNSSPQIISFNLISLKNESSCGVFVDLLFPFPNCPNLLSPKLNNFPFSKMNQLLHYCIAQMHEKIHTKSLRF
jgi:hypothetical protein